MAWIAKPHGRILAPEHNEVNHGRNSEEVSPYQIERDLSVMCLSEAGASIYCLSGLTESVLQVHPLFLLLSLCRVANKPRNEF